MTPKRPSHNPKKKGQPRKAKEEENEPLPVPNNRASSLLAPLGILIVAIAIGIFHLQQLSVDPITNRELVEKLEPLQLDPPDLDMEIFLYQACRVAYCHDSLVLSGRSFRARERIPVGETLVRVPRKMQIWDLDALRDPFIRQNLFQASHKLTGNHLGSEAFLAAYLALELYKLETSPKEVNPLRQEYLKILPKYDDLTYHPILWDPVELVEALGLRSSAYGAVQSYRNMVKSEYDAMSEISSEFASMISREDYLVARINVLTRAMNVGPPGHDEAIQTSFMSYDIDSFELIKDEAQAYLDLLGWDLMEHGCFAMIPIADLFNHHRVKHAEYFYDRITPGNRAFVVASSRRDIERGHEPMISYGDISDAHLFGR